MLSWTQTVINFLSLTKFIDRNFLLCSCCRKNAIESNALRIFFCCYFLKHKQHSHDNLHILNIVLKSIHSNTLKIHDLRKSEKARMKKSKSAQHVKHGCILTAILSDSGLRACCAQSRLLNSNEKNCF